MLTDEALPFGVVLSRYRVAVGLTQEELAERAGLSPQAISALERGIRSRPRAYTVHQLIEALGLAERDRDVFERAALFAPSQVTDDVMPTGDFLGALPATELVARREEAERIRSILGIVAEGTGHVLLLGGEAGVGKTRLLQELMLEASGQSLIVATGRCYPTEQRTSYYPFLDALAGLASRLPMQARAEGQRAWKKIQELAGGSAAGNGAETGRAVEHQRFFEAVSHLLLLATRSAPLAVILDDLHWADEQSLKLLQHLAHTTRNAPILLAGSFRDAHLGEDRPELAQLLQTLSRERLAERLTVRRLSLEEMTTLVATTMGQHEVSDEFASFVYRRTKGVPRLIDQLVRSLGGRLELQGEIGAGAMGRVFRAFDRATQKEVAAKVVLARREIDLDALLRFQQEGAVLSTLEHPNIVDIHDTFVEEHASCIVMELLDGQSLGQILRDGALPLPRAKHLALQVAAALSYAHSQQIVHRDIKPDNVMVLPDDRVKVTDFGIARILQPDTSLGTIATTGMRMGTPLYMAPEQIEGKKVDGRTDVYALGAVLFHMVTGRPPFEVNDPLAIIAKQLQEDPPPPSAVDPSTPADWDAVILKALAKDPARRFQSAAAFLGAIADLSTGEGTDAAAGARPATRRRKRWLLLIGGTSAAVLIAGAGALAMYGSASPHPLTVVGRSVRQWGYAGFISPSLRAPAGIAVNTRGDVYVADTNHDRIAELSPSGLPIGQWGTPGHDVGQLSHPEGLLVDTQGNVYVADTDNYRIQEFSANGKWLGQWPLSATGSPYLNPEYLAGDGRGAIYVTTAPDPHIASNLLKFVPGGGSQVVGLPARLQTCSDSCVERPLGDPVGVAVDRQGAAYVPDAAGNAIRKLSPTGKVLSTWRTQLNHPSSIALDPEGHIYIADTGSSRILKLSANGRRLASWRTAGSRSVPFRSPEAVAVDARGNIYVADTGNNRILKLSPEGVASSQWKTQPLAPIVRLRVPAITVDRQDNVWTVNSDQDRVYELSPFGTRLRTWVVPRRLDLHGALGLAVDGAGRVSIMASVASGFPVIAQFSSDGSFLAEWGYSGVGPGGLSTPSAMTVDRQGNIYVADTGNDRIQEFSPSGRPLRQWGAIGQFEWPVGVALDRHGNIWVVDSASNRIQELSPTGKTLELWGKKGSAPGQFRGPMSIAVDARDHVYVADTGNNRIEELSPTGRPLAISGSIGFDPGAFLAPYDVSVDSHGDVYVVDWHGVHKLASSR